MNIYPRHQTNGDRFCGIDLGDEVADTITGFVGICTGKISYLSGCDQVCIQPTKSKDGDLPAQRWFDVERVVIITKGAVTSSVRCAGRDDFPPRTTPPTRSGTAI